MKHSILGRIGATTACLGRPSRPTLCAVRCRSALGIGVCTGLLAFLVAAPASLAATPPPNDNYLASTIVPQFSTTGSKPMSYQSVINTTAATTQADLFNPEASGMPFSGGGPEPLTCDGSSYGNTIWYDIHPKIPGAVEFVASGYPNAVAVYQWSPQTAKIIRRVGCQTSNSPSNDYVPAVDLQKGKAYTVQIGGLQTAGGFQSGTLDFQATFYPDHDGDLLPDVLDKCPTLPGVERFGGCPPGLQPLPRYSYTIAGSGVQLTLLRIDEIPPGTQVQARCRPCGLRDVKSSGKHGTSVVMTGFAGHTLAKGDKLELWVTKGRSGTGIYRFGAFGSYFSYTVGSGTIGDRVIRCLMPGSLMPMRVCPPGGRHPAKDVVTSQALANRLRAYPLSASLP
jgi:hypothetical protein